MRRASWAVAFGLIFAPGAFAIDPEADKPYDFQLILRVAPHRLLTATFRRQLQSDLQDSLQAALGTLAQVQILDATTDTWLDPATLDTHPSLHPAKRHFVEVAYANGQYVVEARQLDGSTGLASPVVRRDRTADRAFVARLVTRCIDQDFGAVGTVVRKDKDRVWLRLRGGAVPGADMARWVPAGSVFALARIEGDPPRGRPVEAALLRTVAEPQGGEVECRFYYRYQDARGRDPLADWPNVGFRALRLGTTSAPVRLRLVDAHGLPRTDVQLRVSPAGFGDPPGDQGAVHGDGTFETAGPYSHVAFVTVNSGSLMLARVPVAVLDDSVIVCRVAAGANGDAGQAVEIDARNLLQSLTDIYRRLTTQSSQIVTHVQATQNKEALARLKTALADLDVQLGRLSGEPSRLRDEARRVGADNVAPMLEHCDNFLQMIRKGRQTLAQSQGELEKAIAVENSPETQQKQADYAAMLKLAGDQYSNADFEKAIETYTQMLDKFGERPEVRKRLEELQKGWEIKSEEHRKARTFAYGDWASMRSYEDLRDRLPQARAVFETCKNVGDRLTATKLFLVGTSTATDIVLRRSDELGNGQSDDDRTNRENFQKVNADLAAFVKDLSTFVQEK